MARKMASETTGKTNRFSRPGLNLGQIAALFIGIGAAVMALLFPPYIVCGGFFCGTEHYYFQTTGQQFIAEGADEPVHLNRILLECELFLVLWVTAITLMLLGKSVTRKFLIRGLIVGEIGIITIGVARVCLDCCTSHPLLGSFAALLGFVLFEFLWNGFLYTAGAVLSILLLLVIGAVRLKRLKN